MIRGGNLPHAPAHPVLMIEFVISALIGAKFKVP
jgi:hypothetical protein